MGNIFSQSKYYATSSAESRPNLAGGSDAYVVIAIGAVGTGKSTFGKYLGANDAEVGHGAEAQTKTVTCHRIHSDFIYVDTPGFWDPKIPSTPMKIWELLQAELRAEGLARIHTILWFCRPDIRINQQLKDEAAFINSLGANYQGPNIWQNTATIVKKGLSDSQGPFQAALSYASQLGAPAPLELTILDLLPESSLTRHFAQLDFETRRSLNWVRSSELPLYFDALQLRTAHERSPIYAIKLRETCQRCALDVTDRRKIKFGCHGAMSTSHRGWIVSRSEQYHPGEVTDGQVGSFNVSYGGGRWDFSESTERVRFYTCCGAAWGSSGCILRRWQAWSECNCNEERPECVPHCSLCNEYQDSLLTNHCNNFVVNHSLKRV